MSHDVEARQQDLLSPQTREQLGGHLEQIKTLAPILICSMKIFIQILNQQGTGTDEAIANRNYLAGRMHDEISEVETCKHCVQWRHLLCQVMRILEESSLSDGSGRVMNGIPGLNLTEMTFHETVKKLHSLLSSGAVDSQTTSRVIQHVIQLGYKISDELETGGGGGEVTDHTLCYVRFISEEVTGVYFLQVSGACAELDSANTQLGGALQDPRTRHAVTAAIHRLESVINEAVISRIIQDMADITRYLII